MENDIALMASGYLLLRLGILVAFGYLVYRALRRSPKKVYVESQSDYANQRLRATRRER